MNCFYPIHKKKRLKFLSYHIYIVMEEQEQRPEDTILGQGGEGDDEAFPVPDLCALRDCEFYEFLQLLRETRPDAEDVFRQARAFEKLLLRYGCAEFIGGGAVSNIAEYLQMLEGRCEELGIDKRMHLYYAEEYDLYEMLKDSDKEREKEGSNKTILDEIARVIRETPE